MLKEKIEKAILAENQEEALQYMKEYEQVHPKDFDLFSYYISYYLMADDVEHAWQCARQAVHTNPFDVEANYNYAVCAEMQGDFIDAYDYFIRTNYLQNKYKVHIIEREELNERVQALHEELIQLGKQDEVSYVDARFHYAIRDPFRNGGQEVVGSMIVDTQRQYYYVGRYHSWYDAYFQPEANRDMVHAKCEMFPIDVYGKNYDVDAKEGPVLVPVALNPDVNRQEVNVLADREITVKDAYNDNASCKYSYIPVKKKASFVTAQPAVFGRPISLQQKKNSTKKRLVLNIFVDSLNEKIMKQYGVEHLMPHTYKFFENGLQCSQYYSCSEYTLPSIATYWTGKQASRHMNLDNEFRYDFMGEQKNLAEYFKEAGYVTAKIGGNDAITPTQGYIRGTDVFLFQLNAEGMTVKEIVSDTIEHLETFKETNQFVWLDIVDLHHVAGGFLRSMNVQAQVPLQARFVDNEINTTVKQSRSYNREQIYIAEMKKIDLYLSFLYQYLKDNYQEDEIVVTFFSDHGTAFLVDNDQPFISWQRTNVPLMVKADKVTAGICDEVIQATDYAGILCELAGIEYDYSDTDGNLPVCFGGETERRYAFSQSLFVGDPYVAGLHGKNLHVYYDSIKPMENGFRVDVQDSKIWAVDDEGKDITELVAIEEYRNIIEDMIAHLIKY